MTFDKFTIKAQEVVQQAVNIAQQNQQQTIEPLHLLKGIFEKGKDVCTFVFQKLGVNAMQVQTVLITSCNVCRVYKVVSLILAMMLIRF